jgi:hypothetical protein
MRNLLDEEDLPPSCSPRASRHAPRHGRRPERRHDRFDRTPLMSLPTTAAQNRERFISRNSRHERASG